MFGSLEQRQQVGRKYALYSAAKFIVAASILLAVGIVKKDAIDDYYDKSRCLDCLRKAQQNPTTLYEFGKCDSYNILGDNTPENLLRGNPGIPETHQSHVSGYILLGSVMFILSLAVAIVYCFLGFMFRGGLLLRYIVQLMYGSVLLIGFLIHVSNIVFELYIRDGCYVSPWPNTYLMIEYVLYFGFLGTFILSECSPEGCFYGCFVISVLSFVAYGAFCIAAAARNCEISGRPAQLVFNVVALCSVFEVPLMLLGEQFLKGLFFGFQLLPGVNRYAEPAGEFGDGPYVY